MTKGKEIGVTDPFKFPPSELNEIIYACRHPFINVVRGELDTLPGNKFAGNRMQAAALDLAIAEAGESYAFVERMFAAGGNSELNLRPAHVLALASPGWFAKPTREEWRNFLRGNSQWTKKSLKAFMKSASGADTEPSSDYKGLTVERHVVPETERDEDATNSSSSDEEGACNSDFLPGHDKAVMDEVGLAGNGRADLLLFTNNRADCKSFVARKTLETQFVLPPDPKVLVLSAECKDELKCSVEGLYQAAEYADAGIIRNVVLNGHGNSVDLLCLGGSKAYHGLVVVDGVVGVDATKSGTNVISDEAYKKYEETCLTTNTRDVLSHADLNRKLTAGVGSLRNWNKERTHLPAQKYVVGKLYLPSSDIDTLDLPTTLKQGQMFYGKARVFTEGLLRVVIGDAVLQWTPQRVLASKLLRLAIVHDSMKEGGVPPGLASATKRFDWYLRASVPLDAKQLQLDLESIAAGLRASLGGDAVQKLAKIIAGSVEQQASATATTTGQLQEADSILALEQQGSETLEIAGVVKIERVKVEPTSETGEVKVEPPTKKRGARAGSSASKKIKKSSDTASAENS